MGGRGRGDRRTRRCSPGRISKSRYLITRQLIATFCLKDFEYRKPRPTQSLAVSIQHKAKKVCKQRSAHFRVHWSGSSLDYRQVIEVFLKSFRQES